MHPQTLPERCGEYRIALQRVPRILRRVFREYRDQSGAHITPHLKIDNFAMAISLVGSTGGVALLPAYLGS
jgi:LysR family transcriptional regulator, hca operon transcriptional activator